MKNKSAKIIMVFSAIIALTACSLSETSEDSLSTTETLDGSLELMSDNYSEEESKKVENASNILEENVTLLSSVMISRFVFTRIFSDSFI